MSKRRNHNAAFKARFPLEALKGEQTVSELATAYEVHPTMILQWKKAMLQEVAGILRRSGKAAATAEIAGGTVRDPRAKIAELAVANEPTVHAAIFCHESSSPGPRGEAWDDRTDPSQAVGRGAVPPVVDFEVVLLFCAEGRECDERRLDAEGRQTVFVETPFLGLRQMAWQLQNEGHAATEKRIRRLMRLTPIYQTPNTGRPAKGHKTYPHLLGGLQIDKPNQVWCADITCVGEMVPRTIF